MVGIFPHGAVAQLGEHHNGIVGVMGSSPFCSTYTRPVVTDDRSHHSDNQGGTAEIPSSLSDEGIFVFCDRLPSNPAHLPVAPA